MLKWLLREAWYDLMYRRSFKTYRFSIVYAIILGTSTALTLILLIKSEYINTKTAALSGFFVGIFFSMFLDIVEWTLKKVEEADKR